MVMAKLHMICGNCGCNDMFEYELKPVYDYDENDNEIESLEVSITCTNCSTIHQLEDNAKEIKSTKN